MYPAEMRVAFGGSGIGAPARRGDQKGQPQAPSAAGNSRARRRPRSNQNCKALTRDDERVALHRHVVVARPRAAPAALKQQVLVCLFCLAFCGRGVCAARLPLFVVFCVGSRSGPASAETEPGSNEQSKTPTLIPALSPRSQYPPSPLPSLRCPASTATSPPPTCWCRNTLSMSKSLLDIMCVRHTGKCWTSSLSCWMVYWIGLRGGRR